MPVAISEKYPYVFGVVIGDCKVQLTIFIEVSQGHSLGEVGTGRGDWCLECPVPIPEQDVNIRFGAQRFSTPIKMIGGQGQV
jgi:hypothetical protein